MKILFLEPDEYYHAKFFEYFPPDGEHKLVIYQKAAGLEDFLKALKPDAVVMELLFPDASGYEVLEIIRKESQGASAALPVVIYSQVANLDDIEATLARGVAGFMVKGRDSIGSVKNLLLSLTN